VKRLVALPSLAAAALVVLLVALADAEDRPDRSQVAAAAFIDVAKVLLSPRCRNCHPTDDVPLQRDEGVPHAQNVSRRSEKNGLRCTACHRHENSPVPGGPPGVKGWRMPPAATPMVFVGRTPHQLCEQLKDKKATGDRDLEAIFHHLAEDELVLWGWRAGPGRKPPPVPHDVFVARVRAWIDNGAACPP